jgi:hypothetical protein
MIKNTFNTFIVRHEPGYLELEAKYEMNVSDGERLLSIFSPNTGIIYTKSPKSDIHEEGKG